MIVIVIMIKIILNNWIVVIIVRDLFNKYLTFLSILVIIKTDLETGFKKQGVNLIFQLCCMLPISGETITF